MKFLKLSLVAVISLLTFPQLALASTESGDVRFYTPEISAKRADVSGLMIAANGSPTTTNVEGTNSKPVTSAKSTDVAGFVIAANGTLTATNADGVTRELARRSQFYSNEILKTGKDSSAQLRFKDKALMTLKADSQLNIQEYHFGGASDPANKSIMNLVSGGFRTISGSIGKADKSAYRITTPAASIGIRGTDYELIISLDGKVFAAVHDGGITLVNDIGDLDLGADSDYLFAEVGAGQSPLGLKEMPDVFKVEDGKKVALTDEQKAQLAKKLAEGKEKIESLLADLSEEGEEGVSDADRQQKLIAKLIEAGAIETRLSPDLLEKIKSEGRVSINANGPAGEITYGRSYTNKEGETVFLTSDNRLYAFKAEAATEPTGHPNVYWGRWEKGEILGLNGVREGIDRPDQFFMSAVALDADKIQELTDTVTLDLAALTGTTHFGPGNTDRPFAEIVGYDGSATLDFSQQTVDGSLQVNLLTNQLIPAPVYLGITFNGNMLTSNDQLNHVFDATATATKGETTVSANDVSLLGTVVAPSDESNINTAGFAGGFDAVLPTELTNGLNVNVRGMFVFSNAEVIVTKPYF